MRDINRERERELLGSRTRYKLYSLLSTTFVASTVVVLTETFLVNHISQVHVLPVGYAGFVISHTDDFKE